MLKMFSKFLFISLVTVLSVFSQSIVSASDLDKDDRSEKTIIARVCNSEITEAELRASARDKVNTGFSHGQDLSLKPENRRKALEELIEIELLAFAAGKKNITVSDEYVSNLIAQNISRLGSEKALLRALAERGLDLASFRKRIVKYRMVNEMLSGMMKDSLYSDVELQKYFTEHKEKFRRPDSVHLHTILLRVEPNATSEEWKKKMDEAEGILKRVRAGEDFYNLAYQKSEDEYRVKGGDLGFVHKGMISPEELNDAAFELGPGEVSGLVRSIYGFYILKVTERKPGEMLGFDAVKERLADELQKSRFEEKKSELLNLTRIECPVQVYISFDHSQ